MPVKLPSEKCWPFSAGLNTSIINDLLCKAYDDNTVTGMGDVFYKVDTVNAQKATRLLSQYNLFTINYKTRIMHSNISIEVTLKESCNQSFSMLLDIDHNNDLKRINLKFQFKLLCPETTRLWGRSWLDIDKQICFTVFPLSNLQPCWVYCQYHNTVYQGLKLYTNLS